MTKKKVESKARPIINEILEKVKADKKITKNVWIDDFLYGRDNQAAVGISSQFDDEGREIVIEPNNEGTNISLVRYVNGDLYGGVDVKTIDEAYEQIKYFSTKGKLENEEAY